MKVRLLATRRCQQMALLGRQETVWLSKEKSAIADVQRHEPIPRDNVLSMAAAR